ncbi:MAG: hypothetical protein WBA16_08845 [Nonlabens sp.]
MSEISDESSNYPNLKYYVHNRFSGQDPSIIDFYDKAFLSFYLAYDENDDDQIIDTSSPPTLIPSVVDADTGLGWSLSSENNWSLDTIDENSVANNYSIFVTAEFDNCSTYAAPVVFNIAAEENINSGCSNIFGGISSGPAYGWGGANPTIPAANKYDGNCNDLKYGGNYIREVYIGHVKSHNVQMDRLVSFTGNGGGSEVQFCRASSREQITVDSLNNINLSNWDTRTLMYWKRKEIRKKRLRLAAIKWDENWSCEGYEEQLFVIYEEDNEGTLTIGDSVSFENGDSTYSLDVNVTIDNKSKDQVIIKRTRTNQEFFVVNLLDQGCGGGHGAGSFGDRIWGWQDCGTPFQYNMWHRWIDVTDNTTYF